MRAHTLKYAMAALLVCAAPGVTGCRTGQAMTDEMRNQEVIMTSETGEWQREVSSWRAQHEEMLAWYGVMSGTRDSVVARDRMAELNEHAGNISVFQSSLEEHQTALAAESARSENDRVLAHAGLWTEHQRLKESYNALSTTHIDIMKAYEEVRGNKA